MPLRHSHTVTICPGFHLRGGEQVKVRVVKPDGSDYEVFGTINVVMGSTSEDSDDSIVERIVLIED